ncbi:dTDP-glucose 4,6-dehydratase [Candidatus Marinimicrobia bacterium]|nr:dTDP-glucose 4,6-dehydratase [Candidatus Neomarinimicrobiota bacterium]
MKKNILVTGGFGFIGSNFIKYIFKNSTEFKVVNLDKITYAANIANLIDLPDSFHRHIKGDICDRETLKKLFKEFNFDYVVNFAAESHVDRSIDDPTEFINTNIMGTYRLLEAALNFFRLGNKKKFKFIHISTDEVYGSLGENDYFYENTPYDPSSPYSSSKASSDHLVRAWNKTYQLPTIITNCSNNYGPYQFPEKLIPLMIINCLEENKLPVYGKGKNIRDWLYVTDHCEAISRVIEKGTIGQTYNIGGNNEIENIQIVNTICDILDKKIPRKNQESYKMLIDYVKDRPGHDFRYAINSDKIKKELGWVPKESFKSGIEKTVNWYLKNSEWWKKIQKNTYNQKRLGLKKI